MSFPSGKGGVPKSFQNARSSRNFSGPGGVWNGVSTEGRRFNLVTKKQAAQQRKALQDFLEQVVGDWAQNPQKFTLFDTALPEESLTKVAPTPTSGSSFILELMPAEGGNRSIVLKTHMYVGYGLSKKSVAPQSVTLTSGQTAIIPGAGDPTVTGFNFSYYRAEGVFDGRTVIPKGSENNPKYWKLGKTVADPKRKTYFIPTNWLNTQFGDQLAKVWPNGHTDVNTSMASLVYLLEDRMMTLQESSNPTYYEWTNFQSNAQAYRTAVLSVEAQRKAIRDRAATLFSNPVNVNVSLHDKRYCLHRACQYNYLSVATMLLKYGAEPGLLDELHSWTALIYACRYNSKNCTRLLLEHGGEFLLV